MNDTDKRINRRTKTWRDMTREERYEYQIAENIDYYFRTKQINYRDPDELTRRFDENHGCYVKTDGICGYKKIEELLCLSTKEDQIELYQLVRKGMYDCLVWPVHSNSINQYKGLILDDRLDLTLMDIDLFFSILNNGDMEKQDQIRKEINTKCVLKRAYTEDITYNWLKAFGTFKNFIITRGLKVFVEKDYKVKDWCSINEKSPIIISNITNPYYVQLFCRVSKYKKNRGVDS